jgi:predicted dehydrogenase
MNRREFLQASGAGLASLAFRRRQAEERKIIRLGVVGGNFGTQFYFNEHPNCKVQAVSDLRPERRERLQKVYKCDTAYDSLEELIKDKEIDAVAIFTGAPDHVRHAVATLKAGKHVLSAVPACWSVEEGEQLLETVRKTGFTYMMAETSYFHQVMISVRQLYKEGAFGNIYYTDAQYHHAGLEELFHENGKRTWRYGMPPLQYPTHCTAFLVGLTGERLVEVTATGWGDDSPILKDNPYKNPFWNGTAFFKTDKGNACKVSVWWKGAHKGGERAEWYGDKLSVLGPNPMGYQARVIRVTDAKGKDDAGFVRQDSVIERLKVPEYYRTDLLPEPMRHPSGHDGSHTFLTHEFIDSLVKGRKPLIDVVEALSYTVPGIVAHQSALKGGEHLKVPVYK